MRRYVIGAFWFCSPWSKNVVDGALARLSRQVPKLSKCSIRQMPSSIEAWGAVTGQPMTSQVCAHSWRSLTGTAAMKSLTVSFGQSTTARSSSRAALGSSFENLAPFRTLALEGSLFTDSTRVKRLWEESVVRMPFGNHGNFVSLDVTKDYAMRVVRECQLVALGGLGLDLQIAPHVQSIVSTE